MSAVPPEELVERHLISMRYKNSQRKAIIDDCHTKTNNNRTLWETKISEILRGRNEKP